MLDLKFIRQNPDSIRKAIEVKRVKLDLDELLRLDGVVMDSKKKVQALEEEKNKIAKQVPAADAAQRPALIQRGKEVGKQIEEAKGVLLGQEKSLQDLLWLVPNIPSPEAPVGKDEAENVEVRKAGTPKEFQSGFQDHVQLLEKHGWAEFGRIAKVCGARSYSLKGDMARMELALLQFGMDKMKSKGFTLFTVPSMAREFAFFGTGHFPTGKEQAYTLSEDELFLTGTAEVVLNSIHSDEILNESQLPLLFAAFSPCFRREAGSAGRDTRGLVRVHQFMKIEQFVICKNDPAESEHWHKELLKVSEEVLEDLELPYRVMDVCTGDMGAGKIRQFDLESWVPSEKKYRETHSCSALHDWQARRVNLRYRNSAGKVEFCHTLNNTAIATPRILVPLLENHQQQDGSIRIPTKIRGYFGGAEFLGK